MDPAAGRKRGTTVQIAIRFAVSLLLFSAIAAPGQSATQPEDETAAARPESSSAPRAGTRQELEAYRAAASLTDPAALEASATRFAREFPASQLRPFLFQRAMALYERANNPTKTLEMARAVLKYDPENPVALLAAAQMLADGARTSNLDRKARLAEARARAQSCLEHIERISQSGDMSEEEFGEISTRLRGAAHEVLGTVAFKLRDYPAALREYHIASAAQNDHPDPVVWLRMAVSFEKTGELEMSSEYAARAISSSKTGTRVRELAERQKDRMAQQIADRSAETHSAAPASTTPRQRSVSF